MVHFLTFFSNFIFLHWWKWGWFYGPCGCVCVTAAVQCAQLPPRHMMDDVCDGRERQVAIEQTEIHHLSDRRDKKNEGQTQRTCYVYGGTVRGGRKTWQRLFTAIDCSVSAGYSWMQHVDFFSSPAISQVRWLSCQGTEDGTRSRD